MLTTHHPVLVFWGPQHLCFYNEAYSRSLQPEQHSRALGLPGREVLGEIWHWLGPQLSTVMAGEGATGQPWHPNQRAPQTQRGLLEEVDWTCSYSPIDDATAASGVGGVLVLCEAGALARRMIGTPRDTTECKQADAQRDEFLATLGHELRNPLAPIGNALKVLNRDVAPSGSAGRALAIVDRQFHHVVRLLDDLLDAVRIQHGRFKLRKSRVSVVDVVEQALETASARLEAGGNRLERSLPRENIWLDADAVRLSQVLSNLIINASKYSDSGSAIELVVERPEPHTLRLTVHDHGIGIAPDFLERVFELFSQSQPTLDRTQGGLGIGLSLARGIVNLHGGSISAHSKGPGQGSTFVLELPVAPQRSDGGRREPLRRDSDARPAAETAGDASADMRLAGRRILVVEDNHDHAETLSVLLGLYGGAVRWAPDGLAALVAAEEQRPDIVLLDIGLPGLNGYEVCRRLRAQPWAQQTRIVALTGWGQPEDRLRTQEAGFDHHLLKPVDFDLLLDLLSR